MDIQSVSEILGQALSLLMIGAALNFVGYYFWAGIKMRRLREELREQELLLKDAQKEKSDVIAEMHFGHGIVQVRHAQDLVVKDCVFLSIENNPEYVKTFWGQPIEEIPEFDMLLGFQLKDWQRELIKLWRNDICDKCNANLSDHLVNMPDDRVVKICPKPAPTIEEIGIFNYIKDE